MKNYTPILSRMNTKHLGLFVVLFSLYVYTRTWCFGQAPIYTDQIIYQNHVDNANRSIDTNPFTSSELNANSGALLGLGSYQGTIELGFPSLVPANQTCYVRIDLDDNILESLMGGSLGNTLAGVTGVLLSGNQEFVVQAKNGATVVLQGNSANPNDFAGELLKVVVNEFNETFLAITPQQDYQSIRITTLIGSLIGVNTSKSMRVYDPYYVPNALECGRPTYTSYDANGITLDLLQLNAGATDIHKAIDSDMNSFSQLSLGVVTVPSWIEQKVYFEGLSNPNDMFGIRLRVNPTLNIIDLGAAIVIRGQNGAITESTATLNSLLTPQDVDSLLNGDPTTVYFQPGSPVDRIGIRYSSLLGISLDQFLEVYEIFKIAPAPIYDVTGSNDTVCKGTSGTLIANASDPNLEIRWYMDSVGGSPIGITASGAPFTTPPLWSDTTIWVAAGKPGCPDETIRIPISVGVIPTPEPTDINFDINPAGYCAADTIVITPSSALGNNFEWFLDPMSSQPIGNETQDGSITFGIGANGELILTGVDVVNSPYTIWAAVQDSTTLCWSAPGETAPATLSIIDEPAPTTSNPNQTFCVMQNATLADVQIDQANVNWYDENGVAVPTNTVLMDSTIYFATAIGAVCESSDSLVITAFITDEPAPTTSDAIQFFCPTDAATIGDLSVTGTNVNWYDAPGGNLLSSATPLANGTTYYASQVGAMCESSQLLEVEVTIDVLPTPTTVSDTQVFCLSNSPTIDDLQTNESNVIWYTQSTLGSPIPNGTPLVDGELYYAALVSPTCESAGRLEIMAIFENVPPPTSSETIQFFCDPGSSGSVLTVDDIDVNEPNIVWYDAASGGNVIPSGTPIVDGETYYASLVGTNCESTMRLMVYTNIESIPAPTTANAQQDFCTSTSPTVSDLQVNQTNINCYDSNGNLLTGTELLVDGATYFISQVGVNCESSDQLEITVSVTDQLGAELTGATQNLCLSDTIIYTAPAGMSNFDWNIVGGTVISGGTSTSNTVTVVWQNAPIRTIEVAYETQNGCVVAMADEIAIDVISCSDLTITKTVDNDSPFVGDEVVFTITVTNSGIDEFTNIIVNESLPSGYTFINYTSSNGSYNQFTGEWTILGLTSGQSAVLEITVEVNSSGDYVNTAIIETSNPFDSNLNNNSASATAEPNCLTVYNEISPNGDGVNDVLYIDCIENYSDNSIQIFNRFGNEVFSVSSYQNDWDGVSNMKGVVGKGEVLPSGTYFYILKVQEEDYESSGWVYIIR